MSESEASRDRSTLTDSPQSIAQANRSSQKRRAAKKKRTRGGEKVMTCKPAVRAACAWLLSCVVLTMATLARQRVTKRLTAVSAGFA